MPFYGLESTFKSLINQKYIYQMKFNRTYSLLLFIILISFSIQAYTAKIVRPWRATTEIVKTGESFEVWFNADDGQTINSVELRGPFNTINVTHSIISGEWIYDKISGNTYNQEITVFVPVDSPADRYDLILNTSTGEVISDAAVKVIHEYKSEYYIMHISDAHRYQGAYDANNILRKVSAIVDYANIIDPEMVFETGDLMYGVDGNPSREEAMYGGIPEERIQGVDDYYAASFIVDGNHDNPTDASVYGDAVESAKYFNTYHGLTHYNFSYGNGRFMVIANAIGANVSQQVADAKTWLNESGTGNFRLGAFHGPTGGAIDNFKAETNFTIGLAGHTHTTSLNPRENNVYVASDIRNNFQFNLYKVNNTTGEITIVPGGLGFANAIENMADRGDYSLWKLKLTIDYTTPNSGTSLENTATITNKFDFPIDDARVRFVMPKGSSYQISDGSITQEFEGDDFYIIDATIDVEANSTASIYIRADDLCPEDPDKTEPGLCGCGVVEGTCTADTLIVNNGSGNGRYFPYENVTVTADTPEEGWRFSSWMVNSGNPVIADTSVTTTTLKLLGNPANITATFSEIPKISEAVFVSQTVPELTPGETIAVSITMRNTGTSTWIRDEGFKLVISGAETNDNWGKYEVELGDSEQIIPNQEKTFDFNVQVPQDEGVYVFQWQMKERETWFGEKTEFEILRIGEEGEYFDDCDQSSGWKSSTSLDLNGVDQVQGQGCLEFTGSGTDEYKRAYTTSYVAPGSEESLVLQFWYYVSDASKIGANQVELGSAGKPDVNEYNWRIEGLTSGWNFISLNVSDAGKLGTPDINALNWFRIYSVKNALITTRLDAIQILGDGKSNLFTLTVNNGSGSGQYPAYKKVFIQADAPPEGMVFDSWTVASGKPTIINPYSRFTYIILSEEDTEVAATYTADPDFTSINVVGGEQGIDIFPNPIDGDILSIDLSSIERLDNVDIKISDLMGQVIYRNTIQNQEHLEISTKDLLKGSVIVVSILSEGKSFTKKVLVR